MVTYLMSLGAFFFTPNFPKKIGPMFSSCCYLINKLCSFILQNKSPFDLLYKKPLTFINLKVFVHYAMLPSQNSIVPNLTHELKDVYSQVSKLVPKVLLILISLLQKTLFLTMLFFINLLFLMQKLQILLLVLTMQIKIIPFFYLMIQLTPKSMISQPRIQLTSTQPISTSSTLVTNMTCDSSSSTSSI